MHEDGSLSQEDRRGIDAFLRSRRIPEDLERAIENYIERKTGRSYTDPVILERLRRAVVAQKGSYWKSPATRHLSYTKGYSVLGYLAYHFPVYFMQAEYLLRDLAVAGLLRPSMTILDVGTGPGVIPLAVSDFFSRTGRSRVEIFSIERSEEHTEAFRFLVQAGASAVRNVVIHPPLLRDIRTMPADSIPGPVDLLVFSNVINETGDLPVEEQADLVLKFSGRVAPRGTILIVEPAEERSATRLRVLSQVLATRGLCIHSPCSFLWGTPCDPSRCWSFETRPDIHLTSLMNALAAGNEPYRYINTDIKYAYVVLRKDTVVRQTIRIPPHIKAARLAKLHLHIGKKINVIAAKMSQDLGDRKTHIFKLCDGTSAKPVYAVLPAYHESMANTAILMAPYGTILSLMQVAVRYNRRHDSYNLLIGKNTKVEPFPVHPK